MPRSLVVLVALGLMGLFAVLAPAVARAEAIADPATVSGSGPLPLIVVVVLMSAVFLVGLLVGEQWHRRQVSRRERQLADARRELARVRRDWSDRS